MSEVRKLREKHGWSMQELSDKSGVSKGYISMLENGKVNPSLKKLKELAKALGVEVKDII